jgi:hypothetical protein
MMNALATRPAFCPPVTRRPQLATRVPASPMVLQELLGQLAKLKANITALERRSAEPMVVSSTSYMPVQVQPVEYDEPVPSPPPAPRQLLVQRSSLLDIFD